MKLIKLLTLNITLEEAINTNLTNFLSFISKICQNKSGNLRFLLNEITDIINKYTR